MGERVVGDWHRQRMLFDLCTRYESLYLTAPQVIFTCAKSRGESLQTVSFLEGIDHPVM
jgi:hypothetical protein